MLGWSNVSEVRKRQLVEKISKLEQNHREMFFSLAVLSFEDTHIDNISIEGERDDIIQRDMSISGLRSLKIFEKRSKTERSRRGVRSVDMNVW